MPQLFISYARADKRRVGKLVNALRKAGFEPWWDDDIPAGASWEQTIETQLAAARAVIVCWSPSSVASENVRSEARVARARLVQVFIEPCEPPLFFGERQGIDLSNWSGSARDPAFVRLQDALSASVAGKLAETGPPLRKRSLSARNLKAPMLGAMAALLAVIALAGWWWERSSASAAPSLVAVQPFKALGTDASIADSLTDQIATSLNDGHIPTISRTDSASLTGPDVDQRLRSLGVGYTVTGTIERAGDDLHARVHLDDRVRHESLWSFEASGPRDNPATLNSAIARSIAGVVSCAYRALRPGGLTDTELLSRYLRVCDLFVNHDDASDSKSTFELLDDLRLIMAKAPDFAPAQSDFAKFAAYLAPLLPAEQAQALRAESAKAANRALELDPRSADAYVAKEMALKPTDWAAREALLRKAVSVDPSWPHSNGFLAMLLTETGRMREAAVYGQRAAAADLQIDWKPYGAKMACDAGEIDGTISDLRDRLSNAPDDVVNKWALRSCLIDEGRYAEAQKYEAPATGPFETYRSAVEHALITGKAADRDRARRLASKLTVDRSNVAFVAAWSSAIGDLDTAFRVADTFSPGYPMTGITDFLFQPQEQSMRNDPRFFALMKRYGLAQFWQSTGRWPDFCSGARLQGCKSAVAAQLAQR